MTAHFLSLLDGLRRRSLRMASLVEDIVSEALDGFFLTNYRLCERVIKRDSEVDAEEIEVESEIINLLARYQPVGADLRLLCATLKVNNDLERVADCAVNIAQRAQHLQADDVRELCGEMASMAPIAQRMLRQAIQAYGDRDGEAARLVFEEESAVDALYAQSIRRLVGTSNKLAERMATYLDVLSAAKNLERIADHATNIAEDVVFLSTGEIVRHGR